MVSLDATYDYFHELGVLLANCDREVIDDVDEQMLQELVDHHQQLDTHVRNLKTNAKKLDWSSDRKLATYLDEIDSAKQTLDTHLSGLDTTTNVDKQVANQLRTAANILKDDTAGVLEDL